jgi:hypothetical protein
VLREAGIMSTELLLLFVYPVSLIVVLGFRILCAHNQPNPEASRRIAQASYWGEYADRRNEADKNRIEIAPILPAKDPASPQAARDVSRPYCH